jgi:hypothetical protein
LPTDQVVFVEPRLFPESTGYSPRFHVQEAAGAVNTNVAWINVVSRPHRYQFCTVWTVPNGDRSADRMGPSNRGVHAADDGTVTFQPRLGKPTPSPVLGFTH